VLFVNIGTIQMTSSSYMAHIIKLFCFCWFLSGSSSKNESSDKCY